MFIKRNNKQFFSFPISVRRYPRTRRVLAGRARMARYLNRWREDDTPQQMHAGGDGVVPREYTFLAADGREIRSLSELREVVADIEDHHFHYHTQDHGNDFARWLRDAWKEETAAALLDQSGGRDEAVAVIDRLCRRRGI